MNDSTLNLKEHHKQSIRHPDSDEGHENVLHPSPPRFALAAPLGPT